MLQIHVKAGSIATARLGSTFHKALDSATPFFSKNDLKGAFSTIISDYYHSLGVRNNTSKVVGIVLTIIVGAVLLFGMVVTVIYCRSEFSQGKNCKQVCYGTLGGHWAFVFGGGKPKRKEEEIAATAAELHNLET